MRPLRRYKFGRFVQVIVTRWRDYFFNIWPIKMSPKANILPKDVQFFTNTYLIGHLKIAEEFQTFVKVVTFCQSGDILPEW